MSVKSKTKTAAKWGGIWLGTNIMLVGVTWALRLGTLYFTTDPWILAIVWPLCTCVNFTNEAVLAVMAWRAIRKARWRKLNDQASNASAVAITS